LTTNNIDSAPGCNFEEPYDGPDVGWVELHIHVYGLWLADADMPADGFMPKGVEKRSDGGWVIELPNRLPSRLGKWSVHDEELSMVSFLLRLPREKVWPMLVEHAKRACMP